MLTDFFIFISPFISKLYQKRGYPTIKKFKILICVHLWKSFFQLSPLPPPFLIDYKHKRIFFRRKQKKTQAIFRLRFKVQLTYALIFFSSIFSIVPLWSMILSRLSSSQEFAQLVVQKYSRITQR